MTQTRGMRPQDPGSSPVDCEPWAAIIRSSYRASGAGGNPPEAGLYLKTGYQLPTHVSNVETRIDQAVEMIADDVLNDGIIEHVFNTKNMGQEEINLVFDDFVAADERRFLAADDQENITPDPNPTLF